MNKYLQLLYCRVKMENFSNFKNDPTEVWEIQETLKKKNEKYITL